MLGFGNLSVNPPDLLKATTSRPWPASAVAATAVGHISLSLDQQGQVHLSYWGNQDAAAGQLFYARQNGDAWSSEVVTNAQGAKTAVAITPSGEPLIAYFDLEQAQLILARRTDGNWESESVTPDEAEWITGFAPGDLCLALDSQNHPIISYFNQDALKLAQRQGTGWQIETVAAGPGVGYFHDLALDSKGTPVIAYHHLGKQEVRLVRWAEGVGEHEHELVDATLNSGEYVSLILDEQDQPHICCWQAAGPAYLTKTNGQWQNERIETAVSTNQGLGLYTQIGIGFSGIPKVAYYDGHNGDLKFATRDPDGTWQAARVDDGGGPEGDVGGYIAMALNRQDLAQIAYYDWEAQAIKFVQEEPTLKGCLYLAVAFWNRLKAFAASIINAGQRLGQAFRRN